MRIEVLHVPNCPNYAVVRELLHETLANDCLQADISEVLVRSLAMAQSLKFPGSPTIRINGHDVEPQNEKTASFGLMCRLYADGNGTPSRDKLRDAIRRARDWEFLE